MELVGGVRVELVGGFFFFLWLFFVPVMRFFVANYGVLGAIVASTFGH